MNLTITGQQLDLTESLRHFVVTRMAKLNRHSTEVQKVHVILNVEKKRQVATATVSVKGTQLFANTNGESMYRAIDQLTDKLGRQLTKHEQKDRGFTRHKVNEKVLAE